MKSCQKRHFPGLDSLILDIVKGSDRRLNLGSLHCLAKQRLAGLSKGQLKNSVRRLLAQGELTYSYLFGSSWIEFNYNRPLPVTKRFWLIPDGFSKIKSPGRLTIVLRRGIAFGAGDHPTTRLSLSALDWLFSIYGATALAGKRWRAIDIGTGTGILAMAAVKLGCSSVWAFDNDPCARDEASKNVALNELGTRVLIGSGWRDCKSGYRLVIGNLRLPTIAAYCAKIKSNLAQDAFLLFSGIRPEEGGNLDKIFAESEFEELWSSAEHGWLAKLYRYTN